jgi:hypothetical protein
MDDKATNRRRRGVWLGGLLVLLVALASAGYALSSSPSASTEVTGKSAGSSSAQVLAPAAKSGNNGNGSSSSSNDNCVEPSNGNGNCVKTFGVTVTDAGPLYPGVPITLPVRFSNPNNFDIKVTSYRVSVSVPLGTVGCSSDDLHVLPSRAVDLNQGVTVAKNGWVDNPIQVKLLSDAPEGCQSVPFSTTVNASAVKK